MTYHQTVGKRPKKGTCPMPEQVPVFYCVVGLVALLALMMESAGYLPAFFSFLALRTASARPIRNRTIRPPSIPNITFCHMGRA